MYFQMVLSLKYIVSCNNYFKTHLKSETQILAQPQFDNFDVLVDLCNELKSQKCFKIRESCAGSY